MRPHKHVWNLLFGLALTVAASGFAHAAADTSETQLGSADERPNACTEQQIEGGYEDINGECLLTGWNRIIDCKCVSGSCEPSGCLTAYGDCPSSGCGGGHGGPGGPGGTPAPTPPAEAWWSDFEGLEAECASYEGSLLGVTTVAGEYRSECDMGDGAIICTPDVELTEGSFAHQGYYDSDWMCEYLPDYAWPADDSYDFTLGDGPGTVPGVVAPVEPEPSSPLPNWSYTASLKVAPVKKTPVIFSVPGFFLARGSVAKRQ